MTTTSERFSRPGFTSAGSRVAFVHNATTPQEESQIVIHHAETGEVLNTIVVDQSDPSSLAYILNPVFRPDGKQMAALVRSRPQNDWGPTHLMAWDPATGKRLFSVDIGWNIFRPANQFDYTFEGENMVLARSDRPEGAAEFYSTTTGERQRSIRLPSSNIYFIDVRHQMFGAISDLGSDAILGDVATGRERLRVSGYNGPLMHAISPDGSRLVLAQISHSGETELTFLDMKSGRRLLSLKRPGYLSTLSFSPDGNRLVGAFWQSGGKPIQVWDATPWANP